MLQFRLRLAVLLLCHRVCHASERTTSEPSIANTNEDDCVDEGAASEKTGDQAVLGKVWGEEHFKQFGESGDDDYEDDDYDNNDNDNYDIDEDDKHHSGTRLEKTSMGLFVAANRPGGWTSAADNFARWALAVADARGTAALKVLQRRFETFALSYIDTYNGGFLDLNTSSTPSSIVDVAELVDRKVVAWTLDDKLNYARTAKALGLEGTVVPRTFESLPEATAALAGGAEKLLFVKSAGGSGGREVEAVLSTDLPAFLDARGGLKPREIIQEEVAHPALHQGRKFMIRSYFIVFGGVLYVSKHAGCILHGLPYDPFNDSYDIHVQHTPSKGVDVSHDYLEATVGQAAKDRWIAAIVDAATAAGPLFSDAIANTAPGGAEGKGKLRYHMFGMDALPKSDGTVSLLECNVFPYLMSTPEFKGAHFPVIEGIFRLFFDMKKGGGEVDDEMTKVWPL